MLLTRDKERNQIGVECGNEMANGEKVGYKGSRRV